MDLNVSRLILSSASLPFLQRQEALDYVLEAVSARDSVPPQILFYLGDSLPSLARQFPARVKQVYEAGCDLSDDGSEEVRLAGYRVLVMAARQDETEELAAQVADVLVQILISSRFSDSPLCHSFVLINFGC